jgi:beta-glucanase (GH16 family)
MLSIRKKIAAGLCLATATAGVAVAAQIASPASSAELQQRAGVSISILPGVIAPGSGVQSSASAKWAVVATYSPKKAGKKVKLQRQSGTSWVTAGKTVIGTDGQVVFAVPRPASTTTPVVYRVDGPGAPSGSVSTARWAGTAQDFDDEFSGTSLDLTQWQHRQQFYEPDSKRLCSKGDPKAVKVGHGTAQLSVLVDKSRHSLCKPPKPNNPHKIFGKFRYRLNGNIGTQLTHSLTYGVVAARIKFQPLQGQHASLWLQPRDLSTATSTGREVDIIEWFGKDVPNGGLTSFIYAPSLGGDKLGIGPKKDGWIKDPEQYLTSQKDAFYKRYHVFSVEWTPTAYIFRIDGQETGRLTKRVGSAPEYPILSLLSSDYELSKLPGRDEKKNLPQTMNVDWIRTWQDPAYAEPTPTPTPTPSPSVTPTP